MKTAQISLVKIGRNLAIMLGALLVIALLGTIKFPWEQSFRVVFGTFYVLFLPGFIWSYVFFREKDKKQETKGQEESEKSFDVVERIVLSLALSIALGPLTLFFLNKIGILINLWNSFFVILGLIIIGLSIIIYQQFFRKTK